MTRTIYLPAVNRTVSLKQYNAAIRLAKRHPEMEFNHGLTTWWPTKGKEIMRQFLAGVNDRINQGTPYTKRGIAGLAN